MRLASIGVIIVTCLSNSVVHATETSQDRIERGRYLAIVGNCAGCHTVAGAPAYSGGVELHTPFGLLVASNITPDMETGIGKWTDEEFVASLHEGRGHNGKRIYPAMPYPYYTKVGRDDALAIRAYLASLPAISKTVISNQLPFPANVRLSLVGWNAVNFVAGRYQPDLIKSAEWNRGAELVTGLAHCGACHTPKSITGGDIKRYPLAGGLLEGWYAPSITTDAVKGVGGWASGDIVQYLKTGSNGYTLALGPMATVVEKSTSQMTDADLTAIATYLKDSGAVAAPAKPAPIAATASIMKAGEAIYQDACAACHRMTGTGESSLFSGLAGSSQVHADDTSSLIRIVLQGARSASTATKPTGPQMPSLGWRLDDGQVAAVLTYIRNSWGNAAPAVAPATVTAARKSLAKAK